ncbi:MAG: TonB-dependent receptor plug domain-containing protein [Flavobacteriaceae bacterium]|nr:TonB-dependent receptor plug domain-containing protein [Flavobacteriaceae bacterium]
MRFVLFCIVLLFAFKLNAQENLDYSYTETPLLEVIEDIQRKNKVSFSYAKDVIESKFITLAFLQVEYTELLNTLEAQTGLLFKVISNKQIIIAKRKSTPENTVCGYILDTISKQPLSYALFTNSNGKQFTTNSKGYFSVEKTSTNEFVLQQSGYENIAFTANTSCSPIYAQQSSEALEQVILFGYITTGIDRNKDGSIDVTSNSLGILPGLVSPDIMQSIQLIPGISSLDESATGIQIRGGSPDQNLILFDDIKLYSSGYFYGMFSAFNPYATQKASVFKSGTSAAYGDRISGIIDISTGEEIPNKFQSGFGFDGLSIDGYIKTPLSKKLAVYFFARRSYTDVYKSPTYDSYAEKIFRNGGTVKDIYGNLLTIETDDEYTVNSSYNDFSFHDINAKLIFEPSEKNKFIVSSLFTKNALDFSFTSEGETKIDDLYTQNNGLSFNWKHKSSATSTKEIKGYYTGYNSFYTNEEIEDGLLEEISTRTNKINEFGLDISSRKKLSKKHSYAYGYQISHTNLEVGISKIKPLEPEENENFPQDSKNLKNVLWGEYQFSGKLLKYFSFGSRFVHYSSLENLYFEPRLSSEFSLVKKQLLLKVSAERRHQPISQLVEFNQTELRLENNLWRLSDNNDYPLLKSNQVSVGLLFNKNGWTIDTDAYLKKLSGLTTFTNGFSTPQLELSSGKSTIKGLDILFKKRINNYRIWLGYTYNDIDFKFPAIQSESFSGNNDITHSFRISSSLKLNDFKLSLGWQYRTGKPFTPITNLDSTNLAVTFGNINSERLKAYHRLDASATYSFELGKTKVQIGLSALNIYNRRTPISITYRTDQEVFGLELKQVIQRYSLGFTPNASFRLFF